VEGENGLDIAKYLAVFFWCDKIQAKQRVVKYLRMAEKQIVKASF
jgi:hypothetical protein